MKRLYIRREKSRDLSYVLEENRGALKKKGSPPKVRGEFVRSPNQFSSQIFRSSIFFRCFFRIGTSQASHLAYTRRVQHLSPQLHPRYMFFIILFKSFIMDPNKPDLGLPMCR